MSVSRDYTPHTYSGDGAQTAFPVRWVFHDTAWVRAQRIVGGVATDLANGTDYTVQQGVDVGGTLTLAAPLAAGAKLLIWRDVPFEQLDRYTNTGLFDVRVVERGMDRLTVMAQQLREAVGRCVQVRMDSTTRPDQIMNDINSALAGAQASAGAAAGSATAAGAAKDGAEAARAGAEAAKAGAEAARDEAASRILPIPVAEAAGKAVVVSVGGGYGLEGVKPFPAGTRLLFQQSTAPTGWTKDTTVNDKALRVVSGTVGSGGVTGFSSIFSRTVVDSTTLVASQMPSHGHSMKIEGEVLPNGGLYSSVYLAATSTSLRAISTQNQAVTASGSVQANGSNGSHTHGLDLRLAYIDVIIATKD